MIKKVKIRDLIEQQQQKYCDEFKFSCDGCPFYLEAPQVGHWTCAQVIAHYQLSKKFLDLEVEVEIEVPGILTQEEKEWLRATIKMLPFKTSIIKYCAFHGNELNIMFSTKNGDTFASLPINDGLFQEMEIDKCYELEELGL